jgi:hypothetical protein
MAPAQIATRNPRRAPDRKANKSSVRRSIDDAARAAERPS